MPKHFLITILYKCFSISLILLFLGSFPVQAVEIIAHNNVAQQQLSLSELRAIFSMRQRYWNEGNKIRVFVLSDNHPVHRDFAKHQLGIFPHQLRRTWDRQVFSGTGQAPDEVDSEQEMLNAIMNTPNSIGYFETNPEIENVHVLEIR